MIERRPRVRYTELTSLLDVLFIVLFAALIHAAMLVQAAKDPAPDQAPAQAPAPREAAPRPDPAGEPARLTASSTENSEILRQRAAQSLVTQSARAGLVRARVSAQGRILHLRVERAGVVRELTVDIPLVERVPDPDVGLAYLGRRIPDMRACAAIQRALGLADLGGALVLLQPERPLGELAVALVEGLREDQLRCFPDHRGLAVILDGPAHPLHHHKDDKDAQ